MRVVAICDDDAEIVELLKNKIEKAYPGLFMIVGYTSPKQFIYEIEDGFLKHVDMLFLDMEMEELDGVDVAKRLMKRKPLTKIVFVTGYPKRVADMFEGVEPSGLILKPLEDERIQMTIERILAEEEQCQKMVEVKRNGHTLYLSANQIRYVESNGRSLCFHMLEDEFSVNMKISDFCDKYSGQFVRCHHGFAVNWSYVKEISSKSIVLRDGTSVPVSRQKYQNIRNMILHREKQA